MERETFTPQITKEEEPKKGVPRLLIRALLVAAVVVFAVCINSIRSNRVQQSLIDREEEFQAAAAAIPEEIFLGQAQVLDMDSVVEVSQGEVMTQTVDGTPIELIYFPNTIEVAPEIPGIMTLEFQDADGDVYRFEARYALSEGKLTLSAPEESAHEAFASLTDSLTYDVSLADGEIGLIHGLAAQLYVNQGMLGSSVILQGTACSEADMYEGIASIDMQITEPGIETPCRLFFADGGSSTDAVGRYTGTYHVEIQAGDQTYMLAFYNNYPYGFTIQDGNGYYFYHDPVMTSG